MKELEPKYVGADLLSFSSEDSACERPCRSTAIMFATVVLVIMVWSVFPPPLNAQTDTSPGARPSTNLPPAEQPRPPSVRERQFIFNEMEREKAKPRTPEEEKLALAQIAEDFQRIQITNNKMMSKAVSRSVLDYQSIASMTSEIKKLASRLRDNLQLPAAAADEKQKAALPKKIVDASGMKAALLSLDGSIMSFINNPIFKNPSVVNVKMGERARRDLETVIAVSQLISKDAAKLNSTKSP